MTYSVDFNCILVSIAIHLIKAPQLLVSIPIGLVSVPNTSTLDQLYHQTVALLPPYWSVSCEDNKIVCKNLHFSVSVPRYMQWNLHYGSFTVRNDSCLVLSEVSGKIVSAECMVTLLKRIDDARLCIGNPDELFIKLAHKGEFLDQCGKQYYITIYM